MDSQGRTCQSRFVREAEGWGSQQKSAIDIAQVQLALHRAGAASARV